MKILIGVVLKPQGVNGEIKASNLTDGGDALKNVKTVWLDETEYGVLSASDRGGALYMRLKGVYDRNAAELLRGKNVYAEKEDIEREDGRFFIEDVIGAKLFLSSGKEIGTITDVSASNVDIFTLDTAEGEAYMPFLKDLSPVVDVEGKRVTVDAKRFTEVISYKGKN